MGWKSARLDAAWPAGWYCYGPKANDYRLEKVRGDNSPWASHVSACLVREAPTAFYSKLSLQGCLYIPQPWKRECLPPEQRKSCLYLEDTVSSQTLPKEQACLLPIIKLRIPLLQCSSLCAQVSSDSLCIIWLIRWLLVLLWAINSPLSLTPETCVFYQHPRNCGSFDCSLTIREQSQALYSSRHWDRIVTAGMETKEWMGKKSKLFWPWEKILNLK